MELDDLVWIKLPQGCRAHLKTDRAGHPNEYLEFWKNKKEIYEVCLWHTEMNSARWWSNVTAATAQHILNEYTDPLMDYCQKLVESGEAEPLPYGLSKKLRTRR
jgi:hypothetical protein